MGELESENRPQRKLVNTWLRDYPCGQALLGDRGAEREGGRPFLRNLPTPFLSSVGLGVYHRLPLFIRGFRYLS